MLEITHFPNMYPVAATTIGTKRSAHHLASVVSGWKSPNPIVCTIKRSVSFVDNEAGAMLVRTTYRCSLFNVAFIRVKLVVQSLAPLSTSVRFSGSVGLSQA